MLVTCSYAGYKGDHTFPCIRVASVRIREVNDAKHAGNPFRERDVCRVHADEMIASGWYMEIDDDPFSVQVSA